MAPPAEFGPTGGEFTLLRRHWSVLKGRMRTSLWNKLKYLKQEYVDFFRAYVGKYFWDGC